MCVSLSLYLLLSLKEKNPVISSQVTQLTLEKELQVKGFWLNSGRDQELHAAVLGADCLIDKKKGGEADETGEYLTLRGKPKGSRERGE